ncbi:hypothetical protein BH11ARM2_BH11ARM2_30660 [soil metagenome]
MLAAVLALALADTPEGAVKGFLQAWNQGDLASAARFVDGADPNADQRELSQFLARNHDRSSQILTYARIGDRLQVQIGVAKEGERPKLERNPPPPEDVPMVQRSDGWKIIPAGLADIDQSTTPVSGKKPSLGYVQMLATVVRYPEMQHGFAQSAATAVLRTKAMENMKQLALATLMFSGDQDDRFKFTTETALGLLTRYLKDKHPLIDPGTGRKDIYRFNPNLAGVMAVNIDSPSTTVLWYLGEPNRILYPYDGKTIIAFADGSVRASTEAETLKLRWKP